MPDPRFHQLSVTCLAASLAITRSTVPPSNLSLDTLPVQLVELDISLRYKVRDEVESPQYPNSRARLYSLTTGRVIESWTLPPGAGDQKWPSSGTATVHPEREVNIFVIVLTPVLRS